MTEDTNVATPPHRGVIRPRDAGVTRRSRWSHVCATLATATLIAGLVPPATFPSARTPAVVTLPREPRRPVPVLSNTAEHTGVSILVYHRFAPRVKDTMTVRTLAFRAQLDYLRAHRHPVIPLRTLVAYLLGHAPAPPPGAVVITVDDGHESVFSEMLPVVLEYQVPVTLFIYPSAISNASYAMTWTELDALRRTHLFEVESHTYWHPNFKTEKRRLSPPAYRAFATMQFVKARAALRDRLGVEADLIAWPFGIYDDELIGIAREAGYVAGFTLDRRVGTPRDPLMAFPRFLVTDGTLRQGLESILPRPPR